MINGWLQRDGELIKTKFGGHMKTAINICEAEGIKWELSDKDPVEALLDKGLVQISNNTAFVALSKKLTKKQSDFLLENRCQTEEVINL